MKHKEAHEAYMRASELDRDDEDIACGAVSATNMFKGPAAAFAMMRDYLKRHPDSQKMKDERTNFIGVLKRGAEGFAGLGDFKRAAEFYQIWLAEVPNDATALAGLKSVQEQQKAKDAAAGGGKRASNEEEFRSLFGLASASPGAWTARVRLAEMYHEAGFLPQALEHARAAVKIAMDQPRAWNVLGVVATDSSPKEAEDAFSTAVALAPGNARALLDLAAVQAATSKPELAEANYLRAAEQAPNDPLVLAEAGGFLVSRSAPDKIAEADRLLRAALKLEPSSSGAKYHLGRLAMARGEAKAAARWIEESLRAPPTDPAQAWFTYGRALAASGDSRGAEQAQNKSRSIRTQSFALARAVEEAYRNAQDPAKRLDVARLYAKNGDYVKAISQYEACVLLDPKNAAIQREFEDLSRKLTKEGKYPDMGLYRAMVESLGPPRAPR
jgi:tetratricopeptide (TPR) repeat protein